MDQETKDYNLWAMAYNAPHDCKTEATYTATHDWKTEMTFRFNAPYTIMEFLQKINLPQLFGSVLEWKMAKIKLHCHGVSHSHVVIDRWVPLNVNFNCTIYEAAGRIFNEFEVATQYNFAETPMVEQMIISF
jgi:hypothetical protein